MMHRRLGLALWAFCSVAAAAAPPTPARAGGRPRAPASLPLNRAVEISADRLQIAGKRNQAVYSGHAKARRDATLIQCERLVVSYSANQQVTRIEAVGQVEMEEGDRHARGDRIDFDNVSGVGVVTGHPEAWQGKTRVAGTEVTFTAGGEEIEVKDARTLFDKTAGATPSLLGAQPVQIDADRLRLLSPRQQAIWTGRVKVRRGPTQLSADQVIAHYGDNQEVSHIEALGHVEATEGDRWARGDRAEFDNLKGLLVVTGNPQARQGANQMRGTKVTFHSGKDTLEVENARTVLHPEAGKPLLPSGRSHR